MTTEQSTALEHAEELFRARKYQEALDYLGDTIEHNEPAIHSFEGKCYERMRDYEMATLAYKNAYLSTLAW